MGAKLEQLELAHVELDRLRQRSEELRNLNSDQQAKIAELGADLGHEQALAADHLVRLEAELRLNSELSQENASGQAALAKLQSDLLHEREQTVDKLTLLEQAREQLRLQFQELAQQIFEERSVKGAEEQRQKLGAILDPFHVQLKSFKEKVDTIHLQETRERASLKQEIESLRELNQRINVEAVNLTKALKGDSKIRGNWGELVLERVLEQSGLRKGIEYETQGAFRDEDNRLLRPDVIVRLPDQRDIVVDSKVSLVAWERYVNCEEAEREVALKAHVQAVREHIKQLSAKDYSSLKGVSSLDFVLLFMPIESSFMAAFQQDDNLFSEAFAARIVVVTPTTLLATLRTVENIWRYERQSQNAQEIAQRAGAMYDKLCLFVESMDKLGRQMDTARNSYDEAMNRLTRGRGNLISQANRFAELGIEGKKTLPKSVLELAAGESGSEPENGES
ncbi:MAG: DNA recombination protein RmuC [Desulfobulbaceae bacterium]|uniref:DNA recombination protein RmuC n=1 Tax=Candidatus Desulfatifera sulfidica TaxID=2841691 RepID=A0A8J6NAD9_9BACT|nr:DNA recombination protein RmuC [Candidatus Desulfatifera sulfidica]